MTKIAKFLGALLIVLVVVTQVYARIRPDDVKWLLEQAQTWTGTQTFTTIMFPDGTSQDTAGGSTPTDIATDTTLSRQGTYNLTDSVYVEIPDSIIAAGRTFEITWANVAGGVSIFNNGTAFMNLYGGGGVTAYNKNDSRGRIILKATSGTTLEVLANVAVTIEE